MAPSPRRHTALLLLSLLLLSVVVSHAANEAAASSSRSNAERQDAHGEVDEGATAADERCGGAGGEADEECLMRRTLVAHTDYIYTQGSHN